MSNFKVDMKGADEFIKALEDKFGENNFNKVIKESLTVSGRLAQVKIKSAVSVYRRTGATVQEVVVGKPKIIRNGGEKSVKIGWVGDGSGQRWRLVHLNEFGYTPHGIYAGRSNAVDSHGLAFYQPKGFHVLQDTFKAMYPEIKAIQIAVLKRGLL